jgi:atypical dual specificity phosphatase
LKPPNEASMAAPEGFSWIDKPHLAAMALPSSAEDVAWLRRQGIELIVSLTEDRLRRDWVNDAGLMVFHEPIPDMEAPSQEQLDRCVSVLERAIKQKLGVVVHCGAGLGRTGVILACYLIAQGMTAQNAMARVRRLRPGSIETEEQAEAILEFGRRRGKASDNG